MESQRKEVHAGMLQLLEESDNAARLLAHDAYKAGDHETFWLAKATQAENQRQREKLRPPVPGKIFNI
jgi:hypothetical protein